ncbi:MAG: nickel-responsive transcriptional regulator NikR [Leifsonia xyli]|nr:MAG: nickel-responsive transcriptional regulator NikR [Leifsonia xyli]
MQRVTITIEDELLGEVDELVKARGYGGRSEAIRDLVRLGLQETETSAGSDQHCVGAFSYVYDHETRELARRITDAQHKHHDVTIASLHVHLDDHSCLEVAVLKGMESEVRHLADHIASERGVRYGRLHLMPASGPSASKTDKV